MNATSPWGPASDLSIGVVGCGTMGMGIAEVAVRSGCAVVAVDVSEAALEAGRARLMDSLESAARAGRLEGSAEEIVARVRLTSCLDDLAGCATVVEAVVEISAVKLELFATLGETVSPECLLATNTSSIPVTRIAAGTHNPDRVVGLHFFNPVPRMRLVEVVPTLLTSDESRRRAVALVVDVFGKTAITAPDRSGFVVNLLLVPYVLSAIRAGDAGLASLQDIDEGMVAGCGMPMGPLRLADLIGLDTLLLVAESLYAEHLDTRFAPPPLLRRMVESGRLGKKTGWGFHSYV